MSEREKSAEEDVRDYILSKRKKFGKKVSKAQRLRRNAKVKSPTKNRVEWGWIYPDGREVCDLRCQAGRDEYLMRTCEMAVRQSNKCECGRHIVAFAVDELVGAWRATFGHDEPRRMGGGFRDDRIEKDGKPYNRAQCWECNSAQGSRRSLGKGVGR